MLGEEINRRLSELQRVANEFNQLVSVIEGRKLSKESEILSLERKIENLKKEAGENQLRAHKILQDAETQAHEIRQSSKQIMEEANAAREKNKEDREAAQRSYNEAQAVMAQARERQKTADAQWAMIEQRKQRLSEAMK